MPYIEDEWEPDMDAAKLFEEHMNSLEQLEYDAMCEREMAYDYGEDYYNEDDLQGDLLAGVVSWQPTEDYPF